MMLNALHFLLLIAALLLPLAAVADDVAALADAVAARDAEIETLERELLAREGAERELTAALTGLRGQTAALEQARTTARTAMDAQYQRILDDPTLSLGPTQEGYRDAVAALAAHADAVGAKEGEIERERARVAQARRAVEAAQTASAETRLRYDLARVERLHRELNVTGEIVLTNTIRCEPTETIAGCIERAEGDARKLAFVRFLDQIYAAATEADAIAAKREAARLETTLLASEVVDSGFRGQGDYFVELKARVNNRADRTDACALLGLTAQRCRAAPEPEPEPAPPPSAGTAPPAREAPDAGEAAATAGDPSEPRAESLAESPAEPPTDETPSAPDGGNNHLLTVRSNVYYDEVFINGIAYGSTKIDVMLPPGEYEVEVRKSGHSSFQRRITLNGPTTVRAELDKL